MQNTEKNPIFRQITNHQCQLFWQNFWNSSKHWYLVKKRHRVKDKWGHFSKWGYLRECCWTEEKHVSVKSSSMQHVTYADIFQQTNCILELISHNFSRLVYFWWNGTLIREKWNDMTAWLRTSSFDVKSKNRKKFLMPTRMWKNENFAATQNFFRQIN